MTTYCLAGFMSPVHIGTTPIMFLYALPLIAAIAVVYKATKLEKIELVPLIKESLILFGSILAFMILTAAVLFVVIKLVIG